MFTASKSCRAAFVLAAFGACAAPALADEFQYLPDNVRVIASVNVTAGVKTKTFTEFMKFPQGNPGGAKEQEESVRAFASKIGRITIGVGMPVGAKPDKGMVVEEVEIATAIKTITVDEVKALKKPHFYKKNRAFKEIKHGSVTIYQETYEATVFGKEGEPNKLIEGEAFYLAEGKYIVSSRQVPALKKIIDRNKPATLSAAMQAGLKDAGFSYMANVVVDVQNMPEDQKAGLEFMFGKFPTVADIKANLDKVQALTIKINEPEGKFKLTATLICKDKAGAAVVKTISEKTLAYVKTKANEDPKTPLPAELQKYVTSTRTALKAIQWSSNGAKVTASLEIGPEDAVNTMTGWFVVVGMGGAKEAPPEKTKEKSPGK
ncbi:MAG: hypothetical protein HY289_10550 [Planctomycetes bacterium]|nr:hypothetical protein [Planctomycetota bacterium]